MEYINDSESENVKNIELCDLLSGEITYWLPEDDVTNLHYKVLIQKM